MKKTAYLGMLAGLLLTGCIAGDYGIKPADPQINAQDEIVTLAGTVAVEEVPAIDLAAVATETVSVGKVSVAGLDAAEEVSFVLTLAEVYTYESNEKLELKKTDLQDIVVAAFGAQATARTIEGYVTVYATIDGTAMIFESETFEVVITPEKTISSYFLVGTLQGQVPSAPDANGWYSSTDYRNCRFYETGVEGVYSYTSMFSGGSYAGWKIWEEYDYGNWDLCYGTAVNNDNSATGTIVTSGAGSICTPVQTNDKVYTVTVNLNDNTYKQEEYSGNVTRYEKIGIIGSITEWGSDLFMTEVSQHNWYYSNLEITGNSEIKFRPNGDWSGDWGGETDITISKDNYWGSVKDMDGEKNLAILPGKYDVYFNSLTGQFAFIPR